MRPLPHRHRKNVDLVALSPGWAVPVPNDERPVRVLSVQRTGANQATWTFDGQIFEVWDTITELQVSASGVTFVSPTATTLPTPFQFAATYPFPISAGCLFRVVTQLESMTFLLDRLLALPQGGVVIPAQPASAPVPGLLSVAALGGGSSGALRAIRRSRRSPLPGTRRAA